MVDNAFDHLPKKTAMAYNSESELGEIPDPNQTEAMIPTVVPIK